jgi:outer membrane protein assembly factor BamB
MSGREASGILLLILLVSMLSSIAFVQKATANQFKIPQYWWNDDFTNGIGTWTVSTGGSGSFTNSSGNAYTKPYSFHMLSQGSSWSYATPPASYLTPGSTAVLSQINYSRDYIVDLFFYLPSSSNHWISVFFNRHIISVIDYGTTLTMRSGSTNTPIISLNVTTWYEIRYWVEPVNSTYFLDVYNCAIKRWVVWQSPQSVQGGPSPSQPFLIGDSDVSSPSSNYGEAYWDNICIHFDAIPVKVTFRLLAVEGVFGTSNGLSESGGSVANDFPMKSAQYLIEALTQYTNWNNGTWGAFNYTSYIHLLSNATLDAGLQKYYRGTTTNASVTNEIQNFLGQTGPGESNNLTIRIFYYNGHSGFTPGANSNNGKSVSPRYYLCLGVKGSDPAGPSQYQELYDNQLDTLLKSGSLASSNCVLVILDSCYSGGFISKLKRSGRVILTAVQSNELAWGWKDTPVPGYWGWFTGSANPGFPNPAPAPGLLAAISFHVDTSADGWVSANDLYLYSSQTVPQYAINVSKNMHLTQQISMHPQKDYGVRNGEIPVVMVNNLRWQIVSGSHPPQLQSTPNGFAYNALPTIEATITDNPWNNYRSSANRAGVSSAVGPTTPAELWHGSLGSSINGSTAVVDGMVFASTCGGGGGGNGGIFALDVRTGANIWGFTVNGSVLSSPAVANGSVYFGTGNGNMYAVAEHTGNVEWIYQLSTSAIVSSPVVANGIIFVGSTDGHIYALNQTTGAPIWQVSTGGPVISSPAVADGRVFCGSYDGRIYAAYELNGTPLWSYLTSGPIRSTPAVAWGRVLVGSSDGKIYALDENAGTPFWNFPTLGPVWSSPAADEAKGMVVAGSNDGNIYALDPFSGLMRWSHPLGTPIDDSSPAISGNGLVYVGAGIGYLSCLNETTGSQVWGLPLGYAVEASPSLTDGHVLIGTENGNLHCFGPSFPIHDVAAAILTLTSANIISRGRIANITYTAANNGNIAETFNVTISYNATSAYTPPEYNQTIPIHTETISLGPGANITRTFMWNTSGLVYGQYSISIYAQPSPREEETIDNTLFVSPLISTIPGDCNGDGRVNVLDLILVATNLGHSYPWPHPLYSSDWYKCANTDLNNDGHHNVLDLIVCATHLGQQWP